MSLGKVNPNEQKNLHVNFQFVEVFCFSAYAYYIRVNREIYLLRGNSSFA